jgi:hypothetical protein
MRGRRAFYFSGQKGGGVSTKTLGRFAVNKVVNRLIERGYEVVPADYCYDLVARTGDGFKRVEVKTSLRRRGRLIRVATCKGGGLRNKRYSRHEVDFVVAYVQGKFRSAYFVFPPAVFEAHSSVYLSLDGRCRWEKYRGAWHLIGQPVAPAPFEDLFQ